MVLCGCYDMSVAEVGDGVCYGKANTETDSQYSARRATTCAASALFFSPVFLLDPGQYTADWYCLRVASYPAPTRSS
eukprot:3933161-Rhodomonas_salina.2